MRDNWNIDELSDQAWTQMREMLDQEMPVKGNSRKPAAFWWFWMAAAVLLIGTVGFLWLRPAGSSNLNGLEANSLNENQEQLITAQHQLETLADKEEKLSQKEELIKSDETTSAGAQMAAVTPTRSSTSLPASQKKEGGSIREAGTGEIVRVENSANRQAPVVQDETEEIANGPEEKDKLIGNEAQFGERPENEMEAIAEPSIKRATIEENPMIMDAFLVENLPEQSIASLDQGSLPLTRLNMYNPKRPLFVPLEINAGLVTGFESGGITGIMTELRTGLKLHDAGKWSLQTGVGLHQQQEPFRVSLKNSASQTEADALSTPDVGNSNDPGQSADFMNVAKAVESSNVDLKTLYLDMPILLDWQFSRHWGVFAGGRMSWLLKATWENINPNESLGFAGGALDVELNNSNRQYVLYQSGNNAPTALELNDFFTSGTLGLSYRPSARWNVRLQYQHSLTNQLDNPVYQKVDRSLWLSAGLRF